MAVLIGWYEVGDKTCFMKIVFFFTVRGLETLSMHFFSFLFYEAHMLGAKWLK